MPGQFWTGVIGGPIPGAGVALSNTTTLTDISISTTPALPPGLLGYSGAAVRLTAYGKFSTTGTPTLQLGFYYGGVANVLLGNSGAVTTGSGAASWPWIMTMVFVMQTGYGFADVAGKLDLGTSLSSFQTIPVPATAAIAAGLTVTNTFITVGAQWGTASASNIVTCQHLIIESLV